MNRFFAVGTALVVLGLVGYAVGMVADYPARGFSVTAVMVGITLIAIRSADDEVDA